jgi:DNA repair protein RecO (recombination protein O)
VLEKTKAIVFKTLKYGETSLILDLYTEELGLRSYLVNGVRKTKASQHAAHFQLMSLLDLIVYHQENKDLCRIKEIKLDYAFERLPFEIERSSIGVFMLELSRKSIKEREKNSNLFRFLYNWFIFLDQSKEKMANYHLLFLIELTQFLGFSPTLTNSDDAIYFDMMEGVFVPDIPFHTYYMGKGETALLKLLLGYTRANVHTLKISRTDRSKCLLALIDFYKIHVENFQHLNSLDVLIELWS